MAHKASGEGLSRDWDLALFYNLDRAVGPGAFNLTDDVQLVQFFMVRYFRRHPEQRPQGVNPLTIDGIYGPITGRYIKTTQNIIRTSGCAVYCDGRCDPANPTGIATISHTIYTILHMNSQFKTNDPDQGYFDHLEDHPEIIAFAPQLRASLSASL